HRFLAHFVPLTNSSIAGLTGSPAQIAAVESAYHEWSARTPRRGTTLRGYDVGHGTHIFFITADGKIAAIHDDDDSSATLARALKEIAG
ncbi:MAG: SCO family protein, partial [Candidatus Eremiobacteraeota bacterium]|nr:SCO family protein [Candidatus Eremiobacteraeota bacterium]